MTDFYPLLILAVSILAGGLVWQRDPLLGYLTAVVLFCMLTTALATACDGPCFPA